MSLLAVLMVCGLMMPVSAEGEKFEVTINGSTETVDNDLLTFFANEVQSGDEVTVKFLDNYSSGGFEIKAQNKTGLKVEIDLNGFEWVFNDPAVGSSGYETQGIHIEKGNTFKFKNGTLKVSDNATGIKMFIQNYCNLTLENVDVVCNIPDGYAISNNNGELILLGDSSITNENGYAFDVYYWPQSYVDGVKVHIDTTGTIKGDIEVTASSGTPAGEYKSSLTIDNVNFDGVFEVVEDAKENVTINSGSFKEDVTEYVPEGKASVKVDGTYYVGDAETVAEKVESATTAVVVLKGLEEVTVSENVLVINMTGSSINVNGETLGDRSEMYAPAKPEEEPSKEETTTPSISCAGEKDKNCDGVITCDEEMGDGWTWNNAKGVCEYTGTTSNTYTVVNTAVK